MTRSSGNSNQGQKWCRNDLRIALYLRDGLACCYCGAGIEDTRLTLDHLIPRSLGGTNHPTNIVTACQRCNSARGTRPVAEFAETVAAYLNHGVDAAHILAHIDTTRHRPVDRQQAKDILTRRGGFSAAMHSLRPE